MSHGAAKILVQQGESAPTTAAPSPPIVELARFLARALALSYGVLSRTTFALVLSLLAPLSLLFSPIAYLLSPIFLLVHVLLDVFVFTPYSVVTALARNFYPVYVFVGATTICALLLGFSARKLSSVIVRALFPPRPKPQPQPKRKASVPELEPEREAPPPPGPKEKEKARAGVPKTRVRKRVSIKGEKDK